MLVVQSCNARPIDPLCQSVLLRERGRGFPHGSCFDFEKAYDTTWKHNILLDLYKTGLRGRLPMFICDFLSDRNFKVGVGNIYSYPYTQKAGVLHGSILSVTLFSVNINSIVSCLLPDVNGSLYVDDLAMYYSSSCNVSNLVSLTQHTIRNKKN